MREYENINAGKVFLNRWYGKYSPQLTLVSKEALDDEMIQKYAIKFDPAAVGIEFDGSVNSIYSGDFRINAKGTKIFELSLDGKDMLISLGWGGCFNSTRGEHNIKEECAKYIYCASSNGGGMGRTFFVLSRDYRQEISDDDI